MLIAPERTTSSLAPPSAFPLAERLFITSAATTTFLASGLAWASAPDDNRMLLALLLAMPGKLLLSHLAYRVWVRRRE